MTVPAKNAPQPGPFDKEPGRVVMAWVAPQCRRRRRGCGESRFSLLPLRGLRTTTTPLPQEPVRGSAKVPPECDVEMATDAEQPRTPARLIAWAEEYLADRRVETARDDAVLFLSRVLNADPQNVLRRAGEVGEADRSLFRDRVVRRGQRCPSAYVLGECEFGGLWIRTTVDALIPRPDTELILRAALDALATRPAARVLDLCTGSGCLAVCIAHQVPSANVVATDLSADALRLAGENAARHHVHDRVELREGDLFIPVAGERFDVIVCNPQFLRTADLVSFPQEVHDHEPHVALDGGPDGLAFHRRIAASVAAHLHPHGVLIVKIGGTQADLVCDLLAATLVVNRRICDVAKVVRGIEARNDAHPVPGRE